MFEGCTKSLALGGLLYKFAISQHICSDSTWMYSESVFILQNDFIDLVLIIN